MGKDGGPSLLVGLHMFGTSDAVEIPAPLMARLLCHALVQKLPESGLAEATESLSEMVKFYLSAPSPCRVLPHSAPINAEWGQARVRQVFPVTEEE